MRLHVISLPHTSTTEDYSPCAYTSKCRRFASMMTQRGHEVYLYGGPDNTAACTEFIPCITPEQQIAAGFNGPADYLKIDFNAPEPWCSFNAKVVTELRARINPQDLICVITSFPTIPIADAFPGNITVEFGVGYAGITHPYRVFESYAWRNFVYGKSNMDGAFFDAVIPNYYDLEDFPLAESTSNYFLYIGRLTEKKGWRIAQDVCQRLGQRLVVAGPGDFDGYGEYVGVVGSDRRGDLMSRARAVFVPTLYIPPFEGVHAEAMLCGTPVITTDFGVFSETVDQGVDGFRCTMFSEFVDAVSHVDTLDRRSIRRRAQRRFSTDVVSRQYERYFERLLTLHEAGWYSDAGLLAQRAA